MSPDAIRIIRKSLKLKEVATPPKTDYHNDHSADTNTSRFVSPSKSFETYQRGFVAKNTEVNTQWAVRNFQEWRMDYNSRHSEQPCPKGILLTDSSSELSFWLQKYVLGTRKKTGE